MDEPSSDTKNKYRDYLIVIFSLQNTELIHFIYRPKKAKWYKRCVAVVAHVQHTEDKYSYTESGNILKIIFPNHCNQFLWDHIQGIPLLQTMHQHIVEDKFLFLNTRAGHGVDGGILL